MDYYSKDDGCGWVIFLILFLGFAFLTLISIASKNGWLYSYLIPAIIILAFIALLYHIYLYHRTIGKYEKFKKETYHKERKLEINFVHKLNCQKQMYQKQMGELKARIVLLNETLNSKSPFRFSATLLAEYETISYEEIAECLVKKERPARRAAEEIREYRKKTISYLQSYKEIKFKYEALLNIFPELTKYVENDDSLEYLEVYSSINEFQNKRDATLDFLSTEEYNKMSVIERNQLALDRYNKRNKSKLIIGLEYEMYCAYILRTKGFLVIDYGIQKGLEDLGRDCIAQKGGKTYIIQCKYWSSKKEIHENVICQLYGTTIQYALENRYNLSDIKEGKLVPIIATPTPLSPIAEKFASFLSVVVWKLNLNPYPQIKCNINNGNKIYHLPFDQQYWRTKIINNGEFYAWTVKEATDKGFRRAFKFSFNT